MVRLRYMLVYMTLRLHVEAEVVDYPLRLTSNQCRRLLNIEIIIIALRLRLAFLLDLFLVLTNKDITYKVVFFNNF